MTTMTSGTDGQLLNAFVKNQDHAAFAAVVKRHMAMVMTVCHHLLNNRQDAEDAAQAAFVTLAKKAGGLVQNDSVAAWLHHVAHGVAVDLCRANVSRSKREREAMDMTESSSPAEGDPAGLQADVMRELDALPKKYRQALVLFHLEEQSLESVAALCGSNTGTVRSWLSRGRERIRTRLERRGVTVSGVALASLLAIEANAAAQLPAGFVASTCAAASGGAVSAQVSALMQSALKMLFWAKVQTVAAICAVAVLVGGAGVGAAVTLPCLRLPAFMHVVFPLLPV